MIEGNYFEEQWDDLVEFGSATKSKKQFLVENVFRWFCQPNAKPWPTLAQKIVFEYYFVKHQMQ